MEHRPIYQIAAEIKEKWVKINPYAEHYLAGMHYLNSINDDLFIEPADSIIRYFLSNASTWRGEDARRIKAELKSMLK